MKKRENEGELDIFDKKILSVLQHDGRISVTELAKQVGISKSPCHVRLKQLQKNGYIKGFTVIVDPAKLNLDLVGFVEVKLTKTTEDALAQFNQAVLAIPEIEQCHLMAASFDYLLKIRADNIKSYRTILAVSISTLPHVSTTSTHLSMQVIKEKY